MLTAIMRKKSTPRSRDSDAGASSSSPSKTAPRRPLPRLSEPTSAADLVIGVLVAVARKLLFVTPAKKALFYVCAITAISMAASYIEPPENYFMQKHNIFNAYGTKIGWFWTLLALAPFISLTSFLHYNSAAYTLVHLLRLVIATAFWYASVHTFTFIEQYTGKCMGATAGQRRQCFDLGGKWVPGFDISGHTFLLLYSILLMSEEAISFRNWPLSPQGSAARAVDRSAHIEYQQRTRTVRYLFIGIFFVHIIWDFQLIITALYYHTVVHKVIGASFAIGAWYATYYIWYPRFFSHAPILRYTMSA